MVSCLTPYCQNQAYLENPESSEKFCTKCYFTQRDIPESPAGVIGNIDFIESSEIISTVLSPIMSKDSLVQIQKAKKKELKLLKKNLKILLKSDHCVLTLHQILHDCFKYNLLPETYSDPTTEATHQYDQILQDLNKMLGKVYSLNGGQGEDPCFTSHKQVIKETIGAFQETRERLRVMREWNEDQVVKPRNKDIDFRENQIFVLKTELCRILRESKREIEEDVEQFKPDVYNRCVEYFIKTHFEEEKCGFPSPPHNNYRIYSSLFPSHPPISLTSRFSPIPCESVGRSGDFNYVNSSSTISKTQSLSSISETLYSPLNLSLGLTLPPIHTIHFPYIDQGQSEVYNFLKQNIRSYVRVLHLEGTYLAMPRIEEIVELLVHGFREKTPFGDYLICYKLAIGTVLLERIFMTPVILGKLCEAFKSPMIEVLNGFDVEEEEGARIILRDCEVKFEVKEYLERYPALRIEGY
ncbi:unnamed protein product [Moneuplotes crassus]|uniref:Uncharacterized protein n=1 Tax=Euplotes crassus TaxID=5936 RepID=A0AAD1U9X6_EUPCR|nr:unnamed protein product [Moneuplotes crassus]